ELPFTNASITRPQSGIKSRLICPNFKIHEMAISGGIPLHNIGETTFGFDGAKNLWTLSVAGATISGLPGFGLKDKIVIDNFFLLSDNSLPIYTMATQPEMTLY